MPNIRTTHSFVVEWLDPVSEMKRKFKLSFFTMENDTTQLELVCTNQALIFIRIYTLHVPLGIPCDFLTSVIAAWISTV